MLYRNGYFAYLSHANSIAIGLLVCFTLGCVLYEAKHVRITEADLVHHEISQKVPVGTTVSEAVQTFEADGFKCEFRERSQLDAGLVGSFVSKRGALRAEFGDFLYCKQTNAVRNESWCFIFLVKDGLVGDPDYSVLVGKQFKRTVTEPSTGEVEK